MKLREAANLTTGKSGIIGNRRRCQIVCKSEMLSDIDKLSTIVGCCKLQEILH